MRANAKDNTLLGATYATALLAAAATAFSLRDAHPLIALGVADVVATAVVFGFSHALRNASLYDAYWSVAPIAFVAALHLFEPGGPWLRQLLVLGAVLIWGVRLTWNWYRGWGGLGHEDWRYRMLRERAGRLYPLVNFGGIHLFPTILVYLGLVSAWAAFASDAPWHPLEAVGFVVCVAAALIQGIADNQLLRFKRSSPPPEAFIDEGLWRYSRHPNYFGEQLFWWGLALMALAAGAPLWILVGPLAMNALFLFVSIPMMERRMLARRPAYAEQIRRVSRTIPLPRRR